MGFDSWTCVMVDKGPGVLSDRVKLSLKVAACELHLDGFDQKLISNAVCTGLIKTSWSSHMIGTRAGILFKAQIDSETGEYFVNFLLSSKDLKTGGELIRKLTEEPVLMTRGRGTIPVEDLYRFEDLYTQRSFQ